jgi:hypothetical protein
VPNTITIDQATNADTVDSLHKTSFGASLDTSGNNIRLLNSDATQLSSITPPYATNADTVDTLHAASFVRSDTNAAYTSLYQSGGYDSGAVVDIGSTSTDYQGNSGWASTWNSNLLLSGLDYTTVTFHDSGTSVGALGYHNNQFFVDGAGSWGPVSLGINTRTPSHALTVVGDANVSGNLYLHGNITGYDLAEFISGDGTLEGGDVVEIDTAKDEAVVKAAEPYSTRVAGIVSADPGLKMNKDADNNIKDRVPVALAGRVPIKVSAENGPIERGDLLTSSSTPGYAMRCASVQQCRGAIVAKAMGELKKGTGLITGLVMLG